MPAFFFLFLTIPQRCNNLATIFYIDNLCKALHFKTKENLDVMSAMKLVVIFASFKIKTGVLSIILFIKTPVLILKEAII